MDRMAKLIVLAVLFATACGSAMPAPATPVVSKSAPAAKVHPMVGDWVGTLTMEYKRTGQPTQYGEKEFSLKLNAAPTSLGGAGGPCDLHAKPDGDNVTFPAGQLCSAKKDGADLVTRLREGRMQIVDGKLQLSLVLDGDGGGELIVRAALARRAHLSL